MKLTNYHQWLMVLRNCIFLSISSLLCLQCAYYKQFKVTSALDSVSQKLDKLVLTFNDCQNPGWSIDAFDSDYSEFLQKTKELNNTINNIKLKGKQSSILASFRKYVIQLNIFASQSEKFIDQFEKTQNDEMGKKQILLMNYSQELSKFHASHNQFVEIVNNFADVRI